MPSNFTLTDSIRKAFLFSHLISKDRGDTTYHIGTESASRQPLPK